MCNKKCLKLTLTLAMILYQRIICSHALLIPSDAAILQQQQPTMKLLIKFVVPIATPEWYSIGVFLDLPDATIKTIQREEKELKNVCIKIFREWLHGGAHPDRRSWKQVLEAVEESCGPGVSRNIKGRLIDYLVQEQSKGNEPQSVSSCHLVIVVCG